MRKDGRPIKSFSPMYRVASYIMRERNDAMNLCKVEIPTEPLQQFLNERRKEGIHYAHLSVYIAAFIRTCSKYPYLNRFVVNKKIYARNELAVGMVVLKPGEVEGTMNKMYFSPSDTLQDVERKVMEYIDTNRMEGDTNKTDEIINKLLSVPGLCNVGVALFKWMDKHGLLPKSIIEASPFHCTMVITNLGSIGTNYIYHHIYNFGTTSMALALGKPVEAVKRVKGEIQFVKSTPIGIVMDERIADGAQFAVAFRLYEKLLKHPELLELPPDEVVEDIP